MIKKIITHDGQFHADELFAIALIHEFVGNAPVERTRTISTEDVQDENVWIVDVGGHYSPQLNLFDHHHDKMLHASCVLVLKHLVKTDVISEELYDELIDQMLVVSEIDCNGHREFNGFQMNSYIKMMNHLPDGFEFSLELCKRFVRSCVETVKAANDSRITWDSGDVIDNNIRICNSFPIHWKRYNEQSYLVYPNAGKWNVLSIDSSKYPLCDTGKQEFLHTGKFIAVFSNKKDAVECAVMSNN